jgi:small subunit ribosomal protein S6
LATSTYEGMFILDPNRYGRDMYGVSGQVTETIEKAGGEILVSRLWEERKLAYPIKGHRRGTYWLTYFKVEGEQIKGLNRQFEINDNVLRTLILKVDPRIADALVEHASAPPREAVAPAPGAAAPAPRATAPAVQGDGDSAKEEGK